MKVHYTFINFRSTSGEISLWNFKGQFYAIMLISATIVEKEPFITPVTKMSATVNFDPLHYRLPLNFPKHIGWVLWSCIFRKIMSKQLCFNLYRIFSPFLTIISDKSATKIVKVEKSENFFRYGRLSNYLSFLDA